MKEVADQAIEHAGGVEKVIVVDYAGRADTPMIEGRDVWWHELVSNAEPVAPSSPAARTLVMIAYTSGTTGRPKEPSTSRPVSP